MRNETKCKVCGFSITNWRHIMDGTDDEMSHDYIPEGQMTNGNFIFLSYRFLGYLLEFNAEGYILITCERYVGNRKKWKISFTGDENNPFVINLLEQ